MEERKEIILKEWDKIEKIFIRGAFGMSAIKLGENEYPLHLNIGATFYIPKYDEYVYITGNGIERSYIKHT